MLRLRIGAGRRQQPPKEAPLSLITVEPIGQSNPKRLRSRSILGCGSSRGPLCNLARARRAQADNWPAAPPPPTPAALPRPLPRPRTLSAFRSGWPLRDVASSSLPEARPHATEATSTASCRRPARGRNDSLHQATASPRLRAQRGRGPRPRITMSTSESVPTPYRWRDAGPIARAVVQYDAHGKRTSLPLDHRDRRTCSLSFPNCHRRVYEPGLRQRLIAKPPPCFHASPGPSNNQRRLNERWRKKRLEPTPSYSQGCPDIDACRSAGTTAST